jgi:two-component system phosphate regulon sensor histidine kinase PhoR
MIRFGLRERLMVTALAASAAALVAVLLLVGPGLRRRALDHARATLLAEARLMARVVDDGLARGASPAELDALVDGAARDVRARVTIIAPDGRVLADSALSGSALEAVENHRDRPEVRDVLSGGTGSSVRRSATVDEDLLYAAVPVRRGGRLLAISRVAGSIREVDEQAAELRRSIAVALGLAFGVSALLALPLAASLLRPLRDVMEAARRFAAGDLTARARVSRTDEVGELAGIIDHSADQLQLRLTEIARERARIESILAGMQSGLLAVDHQGTVVLANDTLRRDLDLTAPLGRHYLEVVRHTEVSRIVEEVLRTGEARAAELRLPHLRRAFAVAATPFPGLEGVPHGAVVTFQDVTERRRADEIRRDFVANASHELRTPLTSIRGFVEALEDGALEDAATARRFLEKIRTHSDRMASLVSDLLELSRLESGARPPQWDTVRPADLLEDVVASFSDMASGKGVALTARAAGAPAVVTDRDRLRRILENLVENAVKYTPPGGTVDVAAHGEDSAVRFVVADDGPGIAREHLARIFERFYRVDKARSRELGGTGLGLSIVRHLAESVGATVTVASEVGRGTSFTVLVPREHHNRV